MKDRKYKVLIVEDEAPSLHSLKNLLSVYPEFEIVGINSSGNEALKSLLSKVYDLVFIDINIPFLDGLDVIKKIPDPPYFIVVSGSSDRGLEAFDLGAVDYLRKPVTPARFAKAILRYKKFRKGTDIQTVSVKTIQFLEDRNPVYLEIDRITFLEQTGHHTAIHTEDRIFTTRSTLANMEEQLAPDGFVRVHKKYIVNKMYIQKRIHQGSGQYVLQLSDSEDTEIPTGRKYLNNIKVLIPSDL